MQVARHEQGFTLLELLVVLTIVALVTTGVSFAIRDDRSTQLEREALRISAMLESARAQSRTSGVPVRFTPSATGFEFTGIRAHKTDRADLTGTKPWMQSDTRVSIVFPANEESLILGPEPMIGRQQLVLRLGDRRLVVATDGLGPFEVVASESEGGGSEQ
ncbi:prepilin-type N-terminal cleavage/methylation domain-containing protein [Hydrogenophaga sp. 5NK40-0174]|uniref:prepilin-type N-terminal cleavage/methylation domain-containing protein n=1 Tax=Hydrogenophaga sp. 5NK40-0174 TaxID=3127649 RepID=UPI003109E739